MTSIVCHDAACRSGAFTPWRTQDFFSSSFSICTQECVFTFPSKCSHCIRSDRGGNFIDKTEIFSSLQRWCCREGLFKWRYEDLVYFYQYIDPRLHHLCAQMTNGYKWALHVTNTIFGGKVFLWLRLKRRLETRVEAGIQFPCPGREWRQFAPRHQEGWTRQGVLSHSLVRYCSLYLHPRLLFAYRECVYRASVVFLRLALVFFRYER